MITAALPAAERRGGPHALIATPTASHLAVAEISAHREVRARLDSFGVSIPPDEYGEMPPVAPLTPEEWDRSNDPAALLSTAARRGIVEGALLPELVKRRLRLLLVGACRQIPDRGLWGPLPAAITTAETFAERRSDAKRIRPTRRFIRTALAGVFAPPCSWQRDARRVQSCLAISRLLRPVAVELAEVGGMVGACTALVHAAHATAGCPLTGLPTVVVRERLADAYQRQAQLVKCVYGNPFHPVRIHPVLTPWVTAPAIVEAARMYLDRDFTRIQELGLILHNAGCREPAVLAHCREKVHTRGCWVLAALLGPLTIRPEDEAP